MSAMTIVPTGVVSTARRGHFVPVVFAAAQAPSRIGRVLSATVTFMIGLAILGVPAATTAYAVNTMSDAASIVAVRTQVVPAAQVTQP